MLRRLGFRMTWGLWLSRSLRLCNVEGYGQQELRIFMSYKQAMYCKGVNNYNGAHYTIIVIRNPQNSIGKYYGS